MAIQVELIIRARDEATPACWPTSPAGEVAHQAGGSGRARRWNGPATPCQAPVSPDCPQPGYGWPRAVDNDIMGP